MKHTSTFYLCVAMMLLSWKQDAITIGAVLIGLCWQSITVADNIRYLLRKHRTEA